MIRLRELSRLEDEISQELSRATNRLRKHWHRFFPQLLQLSVEATLIVPAHPCLIHEGEGLHRCRRASVVAALRHKNKEANPSVRNSAQPRPRVTIFASPARVRHRPPPSWRTFRVPIKSAVFKRQSNAD